MMVAAALAATLVAAPSPSAATPVSPGVPPPAAMTGGRSAVPEESWDERVAAARRYAAQRPGFVSFAVVDEQGHYAGGWRPRNRVSSASVIKAMLLVAYVNRPSVRDRPLRRWERRTLGPMIKRSDDAAASAVFAVVGQTGLRRLAHRADMTQFRSSSRWGLSQIAARDMARYFWRIDRLTTARHREYVMRLLSRIVPKQRWGIPPATPQGWMWRIKGGWINGVVNQIGLLTRGENRLALAVLIEGTPDTEAGVQHRPGRAVGPATITGVARRLLRGYSGRSARAQSSPSASDIGP